MNLINMKIEFVQKYDNTGDAVNLIYNVDGNKIKVIIGGTALSILGIDQDEAGLVFMPVITDIFVKMEDQHAKVELIEVDSEGAKIAAKVVCSIDECLNLIRKMLK